MSRHPGSTPHEVTLRRGANGVGFRATVAVGGGRRIGQTGNIMPNPRSRAAGHHPKAESHPGWLPWPDESRGDRKSASSISENDSRPLGLVPFAVPARDLTLLAPWVGTKSSKLGCSGQTPVSMMPIMTSSPVRPRPATRPVHSVPENQACNWSAAPFFGSPGPSPPPPPSSGSIRGAVAWARPPGKSRAVCFTSPSLSMEQAVSPKSSSQTALRGNCNG